ncbi:hypothetical protein D3C83_19720 [compost metagenome]
MVAHQGSVVLIVEEQDGCQAGDSNRDADRLQDQLAFPGRVGDGGPGDNEGGRDAKCEQPCRQAPAHQALCLGQVRLDDIGDHGVVQQHSVGVAEVAHGRRAQEHGAENGLGCAPPRQQAEQEIHPRQHEHGHGEEEGEVVRACAARILPGRVPEREIAEYD